MNSNESNSKLQAQLNALNEHLAETPATWWCSVVVLNLIV